MTTFLFKLAMLGLASDPTAAPRFYQPSAAVDYFRCVLAGEPAQLIHLCGVCGKLVYLFEGILLCLGGVRMADGLVKLWKGQTEDGRQGIITGIVMTVAWLALRVAIEVLSSSAY